MTPETQQRIANLRDRMGNPCPTEILLRMTAAKMTSELQERKDVQLWQKQVWEQAGTSDQFFIDINNAVIFGRYPELEKATEYFKKENEQHPVAKALENTIKNFRYGDDKALQPGYSLADEPTAEQQKRIAERHKQARQKTLEFCYEDHRPETNVIHHALRSSIDLDDKSSVRLMEDMRKLDFVLSKGAEELEKVQYTAGYEDYAEVHDIAAKVFAMQKRGIDFSDAEAVRDAPEMQNITYRGKQYNLSNKIVSADKILSAVQQNGVKNYD